MTNTSFFTEEHRNNLPTVRIKKAILKNFKSVGYGEIVFNCGRQFIPYGTQSDILGIYGQNGSGKTSFIEALSILKEAMSGLSVDEVYADCVTVGKDHAELEFSFDLQYKNGTIREVTYSFSLGQKEETLEEIQEKHTNGPENYEIPESEMKVVIYNEKVSLLWEGASKKQPIIDTSSTKVPFIPDTKRKTIAGNGKKNLVSLEVNKQLASNKSCSFIFMKETLQLFKENDDSNVFFRVLVELRHYAKHYLYVVDTKSSGFIKLNLALPIYTMNSQMMLSLQKSMTILDNDLEGIKGKINNISHVISQLIPGLSIDLKKITSTLAKSGEPASVVILVANRDGKELPLRDESDGIRKILSVLSLITAAFNEQSVTIAIDGFDAGIFEYLLGEILQALEESGIGQFIFTSHNLRPLEVINKNHLYFTTTNPSNRYIRLKNIAATNNLRDIYFREIIMNEQDEPLYNKTKPFKIVAALKKSEGLR